MQLYVFGNGNLSFEAFVEHYARPLSRVDTASARFLVGDFRGVDTLVMEYLKVRSPRVTVFHRGDRPRYLPDPFRTRVGEWEILGGFRSDGARDRAAIDRCSHFLAVDFNTDATRTSGTQRNIDRCLALQKIPWRGLP